MLKSSRYLLLALIGVLLSQLIWMVLLPYADTSEPRYAEIARLMVSRNDWITPWFNSELPFWGKPPLAFWFQALFMKWFGLAEISARLPAWLIHLYTTYLVAVGAQAFSQHRRMNQPNIGLIAALIYTTCALSYVIGPSVLTDPYLNLGTTLSLVAILTYRHPRDIWSYAFFIGLSIGALSKGPLALVFVGAPLVFACFSPNTTIRHRLQALPWFTGLALFMVLTIPWYVIAELKTPGFLQYFIWGEHIQRFLTPGWQGDLYGTAHQQVWGTIWWLWLQASFPWGLISVVLLLINIKRLSVTGVFNHSVSLYVLGAALFSSVFFTFSGNILWTYHLPSMAPLAIFLAPIIYLMTSQSKSRIVFYGALTTMPVLALTLCTYLFLNPNQIKTEKHLVQYFQQISSSTEDLYYLENIPFSARYYSQGKVKTTSLTTWAHAPELAPTYIAVPKAKADEFQQQTQHHYIAIFNNKRYLLFKAI